MKKFVFALLFLFIFLGVTNAQLRKVPADVTNAFKAKYPNAKDVEWKDKLSGFDAQFKDGDRNMTVSFNNKGEWQKTEKSLTFDEVPAAVKDGFSKSKYSSPDDWKRGEVIGQITKNDNSVQYRIYVDKVGGIQKKYLYFNPSGKLEKEALTL